MPKIIFVVEIPNYEALASVQSSAHGDWMKFEAGIKSKPALSRKSTQTSGNVWMLDAENALPSLLELSNLAEKCGLPYRAFLISGDVTELNRPTKPT